MIRHAMLGALCVLCGGSAVLAQSADPPAWRVDGGVGVLWIGRQPLGDAAATETTASGGTAPLFTSSSELSGTAGVDGRVGVRLTRSLVAEAEVSYLKPQERIAISGDAEGAAPVTATETVQQFTLGGGVRWYLPGRAWSRRFAPFATAGGGYLRQLHESATLVDTGQDDQLGGGVSALIGSGGRFHTKGLGARFDVRAVIRSKGVAFDGGSKTSPAAAASLFLRF